MKKILIIVGTVVLIGVLGFIVFKHYHEYGSNGYCVCGDFDPNHEHQYVEGKCVCGDIDENWVPPHVHEYGTNGYCGCGEFDPNHEHQYVEGKCVCGDIDENWEPPHVHEYGSNGYCECGEFDPNHEHVYIDGVCGCGKNEESKGLFKIYLYCNNEEEVIEESEYHLSTLKIDYVPNKDYSIFQGWLLENGDPIPTEMPDHDISVYAQWYDLRNDFVILGNTLYKYVGDSTEVVIPDEYYLNGELQKIEYIDEDFFSKTSIISLDDYSSKVTKITISKNIKNLTYEIFSDTPKLTEIIVDSNNPNYSTVDGVLYDKNQTTLLFYPQYKEGSSFEVLNSVKSIRTSAFYQTQFLEEIYLPYVEELESQSFWNCPNLKHIYLSESIESIDYYFAFSCNKLEYNEYDYCKYLGSVDNPYIVLMRLANYYDPECTIHDDTKIILPEDFKNTQSLTKFKTSDNNSYFQAVDGVLYSKDLKTLVLYPRKNTRTEYSILEGTEYIGLDALYGCKVTDMHIPSSLTTIDGLTFGNSVNILNFTVSENNPAFSTIDGVLVSKDQTKLIRYPVGRETTKYTIPDGIEEIYDNAFAYGRFLTKLTISAGVKKIGDHAISQCSRLTTIDGMENVKYIDDYAFFNNQLLTNITLYPGLEYLGDGAFAQCMALKTIDLPNSIKYLGSYVFYYCQALETITIPDNITVLQERIFQFCSKLTKVNLPNNLKEIQVMVFGSCSALELVELPDSLEIIDNSAFNSCSKLSQIKFGNNLKYIGRGAFSGCSSLTQIVLPDSVEIIRDNAFNGCRVLTSVILPKNLIFIESNIFNNCNNIESIFIPKDVMYITFTIIPNDKNIVFKCEGSEPNIGWQDDWVDEGQTVKWNQVR